MSPPIDHLIRQGLQQPAPMPSVPSAVQWLSLELLDGGQIAFPLPRFVSIRDNSTGGGMLSLHGCPFEIKVKITAAQFVEMLSGKKACG